MIWWGWMLWTLLGLLSAYLIRQLLSREGNHVKLYWKIYTFYTLMSITMGLCIPLYLLRPRHPINTLYTTYILRYITYLMGVTWELREAYILSEDRGFVIVANHQFLLDPLGLFHIWYAIRNGCNIVKKELFYMWPFGLALYLSGTIFIDRTNLKKKMVFFETGRVIVTPLDPIETKGLTDDDIPDLIKRTRAVMLKKFNEVSEEVLSALPPDYPLSEHYKI